MTSQKAFELAKKYAPVFAQKVNNEWKAADQIAPIDSAGALIKVKENPDWLFKLKHDDTETIKPKIYYSVCETTTHYFIIYAVYHILDWWKRLKPDNLYDLIRNQLDEHIHDMEGALFVITKKPDPEEERVDGVITIAHNNFYLHANPWVPPDEKESGADNKYLRIVKFNETVDGQIWLDRRGNGTNRVKLYIESKGHGIYGDHKRWGGGDEIWYYYPEGVPLPSKKRKRLKYKDEDLEMLDFRNYKLENIFKKKGLWDHRFEGEVFLQNKSGKWGFVYLDKEKTITFGGAANPPWSWNDHNDTSPMGEIATDPARMIIRYAQGWGPVSTHYLYNPYLSI